MKPSLPDANRVKFLSRVDFSDECWIWRGGLNHDGYGVFYFNNTQMLAHRYSYSVIHGRTVPEGMELDHLCRTRNCVNPIHLEPVTHRVNVMRGEGVAAKHAQKTRCPKGHEYVVGNGRRYCNECRNEHRAMHIEEYRARDRERYTANREARCAKQRIYGALYLAKKKTSSPGVAAGKEIA